MSFTAKDVASLRAKTGAGMMDCKKALVENNGDMDASIAFLRQKGLAAAAKKADKVAAEGIVACAASSDNKAAAIVEVNAQTDFVAKNDQFKEFVNKVAEAALNNKTTKLDDLLATDLGGTSVADTAVQLTATIGEKIDVRRVEFLEGDAVSSYVHPVGFKVGVLVAVSGEGASTEKAADIAMHIAAANPAPEYVLRDEIPADVIKQETEIEMGKEDIAKKPPEIAEKIVKGRVDKLMAARVLIEQDFVKDPSKKISDYLEKASVSKFIRFNLGEGIEKKEDNFAEEVAAMSGGN